MAIGGLFGAGLLGPIGGAIGGGILGKMLPNVGGKAGAVLGALGMNPAAMALMNPAMAFNPLGLAGGLLANMMGGKLGAGLGGVAAGLGMPFFASPSAQDSILGPGTQYMSSNEISASGPWRKLMGQGY